MLKRSTTYHTNSITPSNMMLLAELVMEINIDSIAHEVKYQARGIPTYYC